MITIGVDAHKRLHVAIALDATGQRCGHWQGANSPEGWAALAAWAQDLGAERCWGIEGAWNYGRGLAQQLVARGETVYDINPRWTAHERRRARNRSKSDERDAQAIALYVWRQDSSLPAVSAEDATAVLAVLVSQRQAAVAEATRLRNQAHQLLLQADPAYRDHLPALTTQAGIAALEHYQAPHAGVLAATRAAAVRMLGQRLRLAVEQAAALAQQIEVLARAHFSPLLRLKGVQAMTAAALAVILGPGRRFQTAAEVALYAGVAPLAVSSAGRVRHRLNRGGNRQLNALLYRIALTQLRCFPPAQAYVARRLSEGKSKREALRALKRHLVRVVFRLWLECLRGAPSHPVAQAA
jgi:transposase